MRFDSTRDREDPRGRGDSDRGRASRATSRSEAESGAAIRNLERDAASVAARSSSPRARSRARIPRSSRGTRSSRPTSTSRSRARASRTRTGRKPMKEKLAGADRRPPRHRTAEGGLEDRARRKEMLSPRDRRAARRDRRVQAGLARRAAGRRPDGLERVQASPRSRTSARCRPRSTCSRPTRAGWRRDSAATVVVESAPDAVLRGPRSSASTASRSRACSGVPVQYFGVTVELDRDRPRGDEARPARARRPSLSTRATNALAVPRQAVFEQRREEDRLPPDAGGAFEPVEVDARPGRPRAGRRREGARGGGRRSPCATRRAAARRGGRRRRLGAGPGGAAGRA